MDDVFDFLEIARFRPVWVGTDIHVQSHGIPLVIREQDSRYHVSDAARNAVTRVCDEPEAVVAEVKNWRG